MTESMSYREALEEAVESFRNNARQVNFMGGHSQHRAAFFTDADTLFHSIISFLALPPFNTSPASTLRELNKAKMKLIRPVGEFNAQKLEIDHYLAMTDIFDRFNVDVLKAQEKFNAQNMALGRNMR